MLGTVFAAALLAFLLSAAEWVDPEARDSVRVARRASGVDLAWFAVYLSYAPLTAIGTVAAIAVVAPHGLLHAVIAPAPIAVQLAGAIVVADLGAYWLHRAMHAVPVMWRVHRIHHGTTNVRWWTTFRFHPVDGAASHAFPLLIAALCGFGPSALSGYVALLFVVTVFAHADVWIPGRAAARVVALPSFHRTHHEIDRDDTNFAVVLPVWDTIFGTAAPVARTGRRFGTDQCNTASPMASDATFATQLTSNAGAASARPPRQTRTASR